MKIRAFARLAAIVGMAIFSAGAADAQAPATAEEEPVVRGVAQEWLALVDAGSYAESWATAGQLFRTAIPQEQWVRTMEGARGPLGEMVSREFSEAIVTSALPGAPPGEYAVLEYASVFTHLPAAREQVTLVHEEDGWRVVGAFILPAETTSPR